MTRLRAVEAGTKKGHRMMWACVWRKVPHLVMISKCMKRKETAERDDDRAVGVDLPETMHRA